VPTYKFTARAEQDLAGILDFTLESWGAAQAIRYVDGMEKLLATLAQAPELGKSREDLHQQHQLMVFPYEKHLVYYYEEKRGITVVRILHESMDAPRHFGSINPTL
jgi:toxin ParE1/3/4